MGPSIISHQEVLDDQTGDKETDLRLLGSVIYEDYSTHDLSLNFFTASIGNQSLAKKVVKKISADFSAVTNNPEDETTRDYPQRPLS